MPLPIKLIAIDLDDTLLKTDLSVSDMNRQALATARNRGIRIVLSSGRNIYSMKRYAHELELTGSDELMICNNGAQILQFNEDKTLYENKMSPELCREVAEILKVIGLPWQIYMDGKIYVSIKNFWTEQDTRLTGQPNELVQDPEQWFSQGQLKFVVPGEPELVAKASKILSERFVGRASIITSKPYFLEVLDAGSDKGIALAWLADYLGIQREEVMAIGDAANDLGMIRWAGLGCAVGNAGPDIKAAARLVAEPHHEQDAVAWLLKKAELVG
jgi:Cof subfamily protein (haloacid dehalogenase superfamily)